MQMTGGFAMILMLMMIMLIAAWGVKAREEEGNLDVFLPTTKTHTIHLPTM